MQILLIEFEAGNTGEMKKHIDKCVTLLEEGGDWEKKNKLKVYEGVYAIMVRDFKTAAIKFLDCMSTFNAPEVISFENMIFYIII